MVDKLTDIFERQRAFMELLVEDEKMPPFPVNLTTKQGQRLIKETVYNQVEELMEATMVMKNKAHRRTDDRTFDRQYYLEEIGDAFAFFVETCILSGIDARELYEEYCRKNAEVVAKFNNGY